MTEDNWWGLALTIIGAVAVVVPRFDRMIDGGESLDRGLDMGCYIGGAACIVVGLFVLLT